MTFGSSPFSFVIAHRSLPRLLVALAICLQVSQVDGQTKDDWQYLMGNLTTGYNRDIRPVIDWGAPTVVYMTVRLLAVQDLDENAQTMKTNVILQIEWQDLFLSWNPTNYGGVDTVLLRQNNTWLPDIVVGNTVTSQTQLGYDNLQVRVDNNSWVKWIPSGIFETSCDIDITYYPFDTQVCTIIFKTTVSSKDEIYVYIDKETPIDLGDYSPNGLWDLKNSSAENLGEDNDSDWTVTQISFKLQLQRRKTYYVMNIILPIVFLSVTSSLTFALPCESEEKMGLSITILLAYAVYLTIITGSMPATSTQVSVLTVYLILLLAVTTATVVLSVFMLRFHHRPTSQPFTGCFAAFILGLRKVMCLGPHPDEEEEENEEDEGDRKGLEPINTITTPAVHRGVQGKKNSVSPLLVKRSASSMSESGDLKKGGGKRKVTGRCVANTLDLFIFILFTCISLGSTLVCLAILTKGAFDQEASTSLA